jgi:tetratricopeptide (TPR) repeat protein
LRGQKKIFKKYNKFVSAESKEEKNKLRTKIKQLLADYSDLDSNCYHILGLLDFESDDWEDHIEQSICNFKKAIDLDKTNVLPQLYLAHCYHDLNQLELALEYYKKVDKEKLKAFQIWRYTKLIEQIGYCEYKLGNKQLGEQYFKEVLEWYRKLPEIDRVVPSELIECLPEEHWIVKEMKTIETYLD